ncbi:hypothetical protein EYC84_003387 [Monilinia fructicola]|uniref:Uncharacterized protein n=1 Tax=Monilinia fructicola TaxID=38448 RepID=A0A5M9JTG8_MONFR|nr:hypothetical protein EYC84_003387 [Monilinia fructicola]
MTSYRCLLGPTDEFPGEKAWIMRDAKEGKAVDEYGDTATQIDQRLKQEGSQYRQKATASSWGTRFLQPEREGRGLGQAPIRHLRIKREITDASEDTRSRSSSTGAVNSAVTRSFTKLNLIAMNTQQGDWSTCRELQHSLGIAQLPALSSVNILQTLDEMIKEEGRIPRQLA